MSYKYGDPLDEATFHFRADNFTLFLSDRCDLKNTVYVLKADITNQVALCSDFAEMAAHHAHIIHKELNSFSGYTNVVYKFIDEDEFLKLKKEFGTFGKTENNE